MQMEWQTLWPRPECSFKSPLIAQTCPKNVDHYGYLTVEICTETRKIFHRGLEVHGGTLYMKIV